MHRRRTFLVAGAASALPMLPLLARAKTWPDGPIRIILAQASGSGPDMMARAIAEHLTAKLGVPVIVDSKPGASGLIAMDATARSAPDGQTLVLSLYSQYAQVTALFKKPLVDPTKVVQPIAVLGTGVAPLMVRKDFPAENFREFLAIARSRPVTFGTFSLGSNAHLMMAQFIKDANAKVEVIPYKGSGPMMTDLAAGHVDCAIASLASAKGFLQQQRVRPILIVTSKRSPHLPGLPTWADEGFTAPSYDLREYYLLSAPIGMPPDLVARLGALVQDAAQNSEKLRNIRATLLDEEPPMTGEPLAQMIKTTVPVWHSATKSLGISLD